MWEIRVYGNSTSDITYNGNIFFTTLNVTNASNINQQFSSIDFGVINASNTVQKNITLKNEGNLTLTNVRESKDIYYVKRFGDSVAQNFTFLVPDSSIASKVKAVLNWTGAANYSLSLLKPDGTLIANSTNKYVFANVSGAEREEYNETTDITSGYWRIEVKNNTPTTDPYNVTLFIYLRNSSNWFASNYSTSGFTFNRTGLTNSTYTIQINFTVQNTTLDGIYEGYLQYLDQNNVGIKIPIKVNVTTPMLVVNQTINSSTVRITENINANLTKVLNITMNNTGTYDLSNIVTTNSTSLNYSSYYIGFISIQSPSSLSAGASATINITLNLSTNTTNDQIGIYKGWVYFNTSSSQYSSHPYDFNLSIEFNLTNLLNVSVTDIKTTDNDNVANVTVSAENATIQYLNVRYINGTPITGITIIFGSQTDISNITSVRLYEANASYWIPSATGSLIKTALSQVDPLLNGNYQFNITIPANQPGGQYEVHINVTTKDGKLYGESSNRILIINNTGLYMSEVGPLSSSITVDSDVYYNVSVKNFGPLDAYGGNITFNDNGCTYVTITTYDYGPSGGPCSATGSGDTFTLLSMSAYNISGCWFRWKVHGDANGTYSGMFVKGGSTWFKI
jgi:hypothetical protein